MKTEHEYAQVLRWIADGEELQFEDPTTGWCYIPEANLFAMIHSQRAKGLRFRIKPRTILINGIEVPEPMRVVPEMSTRYWYVDVRYGESSAHGTIWQNDATDQLMLKRGLIHLTREAAETHNRALLSFTEVKE